jgi:hypothetical protein
MRRTRVSQGVLSARIRHASVRDVRRSFASLRMTVMHGVEFSDRTVPMSEAARRAV